MFLEGVQGVRALGNMFDLAVAVAIGGKAGAGSGPGRAGDEAVQGIPGDDPARRPALPRLYRSQAA